MEYGLGVAERTGVKGVTVTVRCLEEYELGEEQDMGDERFEEFSGRVPADYVVFYQKAEVSGMLQQIEKEIKEQNIEENMKENE
jgi:hypothetical protein